MKDQRLLSIFPLHVLRDGRAASASLLRRAGACLHGFRRDEKGAVAILVAVAAIPLIAALGLATDTARGYIVKARLSQALDAAALAGGKNMFGADRDADIEMFFDANFPPGFMGATVARKKKAVKRCAPDGPGSPDSSGDSLSAAGAGGSGPRRRAAAAASRTRHCPCGRTAAAG